VQRAVQLRQGDWTNYLRGALLRARRVTGRPLAPMSATVGSDLPAGAALSSSHALCTAVLSAALAINGGQLDALDLVLAVRDAEWYTGARSGLSDQAAMVLGGRGELVNVALFQDRVDDGPRRLAFPDDLRLLVVNSHTARSLSGAQLVEYTRNRFAYSLAITVARQELAGLGVPSWKTATVDRLSALSPRNFEAFGGEALLYRMLRRVPEDATLAEIRARYAPPTLAEDYDRYFGGVPEEQRPRRIHLRGPLLYGIAESERAWQFIRALEDGALEAAGQLMTAGHDGDRRVCRHGQPFVFEVDDAALRRVEYEEVPVALCPGVYGASTPVLDALVDTALAAGALGASLTGAGLAGSVIALCRAADAPGVAAALRATLAADAYAELAGWDAPLHGTELEQAVLENRAVAAAGELRL
jgi:galactokinase